MVPLAFVLAVAAVVVLPLLLLRLLRRSTCDAEVCCDPCQPREWLSNLATTPLAEVPGRFAVKDKGVELVEGTEQCVVWAKGPAKTPLAVVYVHGWSSSRQENHALIANLAKCMQANLVCARLTGHGRVDRGKVGCALSNEATPTALYQDAVDAAHVGLRVGDRLILCGASTGGALCAWLASQPCFAPRVGGLFLLAPAFALADPLYPVLGVVMALLREALPPATARVVRTAILHAALGKTKRAIDIVNEDHALYWTLEYPSEALLTVVDVIWSASRFVDARKLTCPTAIACSEADPTVSYAHTAKRFQQVVTETNPKPLFRKSEV